MKTSNSLLDEPIGFIGLGVMGLPIALNLAQANTKLIVWNRSEEPTKILRAAGAQIADTIDDVFRNAKTVIMMLVDSNTTDLVLGRGTSAFSIRVEDHTLINMSSVSPEYSISLAASIQAAKGEYIEAPVSGSRKPAETGELVVLLGGASEVIDRVRPIFAPMSRASFLCGQIGNALLMKLSVNLYLNTMLVGLAEAVHFAEANNLDLNTFRQAIDSGPMASDVTRVKIPKLLENDFSVQAATSDANTSCQLIANVARRIGIETPLLDLSLMLYGESVELGNSRADMVSVIESIRHRSAVIKI